MLAVFATLALAACSSAPEQQEDIVLNDADAGYKRIQRMIEIGNFATASELLQQYSTRYPFGPYSTQVKLDQMYVAYKIDDTEKALATIDSFLSLNPNHKDIDYVMYMRGLVNQRAEYNLFQELAGIDRADRDASFAKQAFEDFAALVREFPDSKYAADAKQRMVWLKSRLARHELAVADYYIKREAFLAAANRGRYILENFQDTPEVERALEIMVISYDAINLPELRSEALATLRKNFPNNMVAARNFDE